MPILGTRLWSWGGPRQILLRHRVPFFRIVVLALVLGTSCSVMGTPDVFRTKVPIDGVYGFCYVYKLEKSSSTRSRRRSKMPPRASAAWRTWWRALAAPWPATLGNGCAPVTLATKSLEPECDSSQGQRRSQKRRLEKVREG